MEIICFPDRLKYMLQLEILCCLYSRYIFFLMMLLPNMGNDLLILEVSSLHTMTHHSQ